LNSCSLSTYAGGLFQSYLVRLKSDSSMNTPRAPGQSPAAHLKNSKESSLRSLEQFENFLKPHMPQTIGEGSGPRASISPKVTKVDKFWFIQSARVVVRKDFVSQLSAAPGVVEVVPDEEVTFLPLEEMPVAEHIAELNFVEAFQDGLNGEGLNIGVIDSGILEHEEFEEKVSAYKDFTLDPKENWSDEAGHGTHVSGLLVAGGDSGKRIGIVPKAKLTVAKVMEPVSNVGSQEVVGQRVKALASRVLQAMQWMLDPDGDPTTDDMPRVVNNSWGFPKEMPLSRGFFEQAISMWKQAGIIPVFAAGNLGREGKDSIVYPGNSYQVITIGALKGDKRAHFSSMGSEEIKKPDFMTPGYRLYSLKVRNGEAVYGRMSGTSMAAPLVSGLISLMLQIDPGLDFQEIYHLLKQNCEDLGDKGWDSDTGWGKLKFPEVVHATEDYFRARIQDAPDSSFALYTKFLDSFELSRNPFFQKKLVQLELAYMKKLELLIGKVPQVVVDRWKSRLQSQVRLDSRMEALQKRLHQREKFLKLNQ